MNVFDFYKNQLVAIKHKDKKELLENVYITNFVHPFFIEVSTNDTSFLLNLNYVDNISKQEDINRINSFDDIVKPFSL